MMRIGQQARYRVVLALMLLSGFAGLGYQILWTMQCASWLGHESAAVLAVLGAFFGGLALGGLALGPGIDRAARPALCYAACELTIGLWSLLLRFASAPIAAWLQRAIGSAPSPAWHWLVVFSSTLVLFLPATAAMGATLPAMDRLCSSWFERRSLAALYAANTCGALLGVLASAFWLIPRFGLTASASLCIALNLLCAAVACFCLPEPLARRPSSAPLQTRLARRSLARLAATGLLGIGYEVLVQRVLSQVSEDTVYTFALLLAVYLLGSALGAAAYQRFLASSPARAPLSDRLLLAAASACLLGTCSLWGAERIKSAALELLGTGFVAALAVEALLATAAFLAPTLVMGALFCHLSREARDAGVSFGRALGVNTLAAAAAPALCGVLLVPFVGAKWALLAIAAGYLALPSNEGGRTKLALVPGSLWLGLALFAPALTFVEVPAGGQLIAYEEGVLAAVSVVEDADGVRRLRINNREQEGSSASRRVDARQAWLPLLLHPSPHQALFLGLGTGVTASAAAADPTLSVEAVELLPEVIATAGYFGDESRARLRVRAGDARRYVRTAERAFDVIVSDNFHPARSGSGALYTVEHFSAVRERLAHAGLFCQWLPLHQLDLETLRSIVRSFVTVFPEGSALLANNGLQTPVIGLVGTKDGFRFDFSRLRERLRRFALPEQLRELGLEDEWAVFGSFIAGPAALRRFSGNAPENSDDHPIVAYRAPRIAYAPDSTPGERLGALLGELSILPAQLIGPSLEPSDAQRLGAYWSARDRFIEAGRSVRAAASAAEMLAQVRAPLLTVLRISPDFRPAYDPLLSMAIAVQRSNPDEARLLLGELSRLQPVRGEATRLLTLAFAQAPNAAPAAR